MGMPLTAIADDRDLLGLDQIHVGIAIVVNAHHTLLGEIRIEMESWIR